MTRKEAAERAGLADASIRFAMRKGHVLACYNGELAALRTSLRAKTVHRFAGTADDSKNDMARVSALKALETISDVADATMQQVAPGLVFYINVGNGNPPRIIDPSASAQIEGESVRRDRSPA
jgi:hypothetical protein